MLTEGKRLPRSTGLSLAGVESAPNVSLAAMKREEVTWEIEPILHTSHLRNMYPHLENE